jgi:DNA-binding NtrC family response regulator
MDRKRRILVCDDDAVYLTAVKRFLTRDTLYEVKTVLQGEEAMVELKSSKWDLILLDVNLHRPNAGFDFIGKFRDLDPQVTVMMLSGEKDFQVVRKALQLGAVDYFPKDGSPEELVFSIERVLDTQLIQKRSRQKDAEVKRTQKKIDMIGASPAMMSLKTVVERARKSNFNVLITGETGCGKEVVARHLRSQDEKLGIIPFVAVDSSTIQSTTAESQLFGHEKGAFTGADKQRSGLFEEADGGIIYFDEIENMPLDIQSKLLRAIQEKEITRFGGSQVIELDFRVVAATNKNIPDLVKEGKFREDLYQRLNVIPIRVPALRERTEDIPALVEYFSEKHGYDGRVLEFSEEALEALKLYSWPGNVRELGNMIAFLTAMKEDPYVHLEDLPVEVRSPARSVSATPQTTVISIVGAAPNAEMNYHRRMAQYEKAILVDEYTQSRGNISRMATKMGLDRSTLYSKLAMHGIHKASARAKDELESAS